MSTGSRLPFMFRLCLASVPASVRLCIARRWSDLSGLFIRHTGSWRSNDGPKIAEKTRTLTMGLMFQRRREGRLIGAWLPALACLLAAACLTTADAQTYSDRPGGDY